MPVLTIARAAREAGVNIETVRFYERRGLIERPPKGEGYRVYSPDHVARIRFIKEAQQIGFSLAEAKELLALRADPNADCSARPATGGSEAAGGPAQDRAASRNRCGT